MARYLIQRYCDKYKNMTLETLNYKGLTFCVNKELDYIELIVDKENFDNKEKYIYSMSYMLELLLHKLPSYLIINKLNSSFEIQKEMFNFTRNNIFQPLKSSGIKRFIFLVKEDEYNLRYKRIGDFEPDAIAFTSKENIEKWIAINN